MRPDMMDRRLFLGLMTLAGPALGQSASEYRRALLVDAVAPLPSR